MQTRLALLLALVVFRAYCPCVVCCGKWSRYGLTASGVRPVAGVTIAAPRSVPFGTKVHVEGLGWRTVQDRSKRDGWELYFRTHDEARRFGVQRLEVR